MALDRLIPVSTTPGAVTGDAFMDAVQEEVTGLWDRSTIRITGVSGVDTITGTVTPALTAGLLDGMHFILRTVGVNTGAVTFNGVAVKDSEGNALTAGALRNGGIYFLEYVSAATAYFIIGYFPAAAVTPGSKLLRTIASTASSQSTFDFVHGASGVVLDSTYDHYKLAIWAKPATDDVEPWLRVGTGAGPTYQTTLYHWTFHEIHIGGGGDQDGNSVAQINLGIESGIGKAVGNASGEGFSGEITFHAPAQANMNTNFNFATSRVSAAGLFGSAAGAGQWRSNTALTAVRFQFETGAIAEGRASLYGLSLT